MTSSNPRIIAVIPARMASSRFPGKPLAPILGLPMIEHVYRRTAMSTVLDAVYVATCDREIYEVVTAFGGNAIMTAHTHERASDRVAEAVESLEGDIIVMVQGDEPMVRAEMIQLAVEPMLADETVGCVNLMARIKSVEAFEDRNEIKVVVDQQGFALYMSREPIPTRVRLGDSVPMFKQVCIIPFRRDALFTFTQLPPTPLEQAESIDMLRFLEHGYRVKMVESPYETYSVDTPADLELVEEKMKSDPLVALYHTV